ncbi:MAG: hypothetical protein IPM48_05675 [Saprospiraceae bacterium]|nr:hypothetical protein [Saprospiraceae bacterium]
MPYRYFLIPILLITGIYFWYGFTRESLNATVILMLVILAVGVFIFKHQINDYFYQVKTPDLSEREKLFLSSRYSFILNMASEEKNKFFIELSRACLVHEFIPMNLAKFYEELKWMVLVPAVKLGVFKDPKIWKRYQRTVVYQHPFISPNIGQVHVCEHDREDGVLIFSEEQLNASFWEPDKYFNPAWYEWCLIITEEKNPALPLLSEQELIEFCPNIFKQTQEAILNWLGLQRLSTKALVLMACVFYEDEMKKRYQSHLEAYELSYQS